MSDKTENLIRTHSSWRDHVTPEERARLLVLEERIERKRRSLDETIAERQKIMSRSIRRMRRKAGKD
ncbi:hypothetical protein XMM379_002707 [Aliiroseovarius sp. xm-m-379]|uniref:Uncharacterized protein n=1 Tax=Aliiroseovarius crassostreae TaxID=154981 RepID=A0A0P7JTI5_9RHOB|nr:MULTISPECIES: hypothetical protein [Aliiroseovarius]KPN64700.1 hypothetical protein AKJ29_05500 [Aliiroseovarius crassostreae]NRP13362.1 hypothetical protein [Aliiroseovarius sp. xm-d-517]NRP26001.1 hypothetical protein [Aliiroseovarius sp. xm-m-379]NRP30368.1 hypothetical protein [Aliiroseovarius sp. xm-m-314]NRP34800.1 hypothetical protein [Aliiroseovarius sp. xm-a-104]